MKKHTDHILNFIPESERSHYLAIDVLERLGLMPAEWQIVALADYIDTLTDDKDNQFKL